VGVIPLAGAPIGVGGVAFEPVEVKAADHDLLVLCTDGLVEMRGQDIGSGLAALCENLAAPGVTPDGLCDILMRTLHTEDREDDVALLVAGLRGIPSTDVAQWLLIRALPPRVWPAASSGARWPIGVCRTAAT